MTQEMFQGRSSSEFRPEFKLEAVRVVTEGVLSLASAARDLRAWESVLGRQNKQLA
jgi:transposase-like protein